MSTAKETQNDTPEPLRLTEEQREFAAKNHRLIYSTLNMRRLQDLIRACGGRDEAEGIAVDAYMRAVVTYDPSRAALSTHVYWCIRNALSACADTRRRKDVRRQRHAADVVYAETERTRLAGREDRNGEITPEAISAALTQLTPRHREVLTLRYVERLTLRDVGARMGVTKTRVEQLLVPAEAALVARLGVPIRGKRRKHNGGFANVA